MSRMKLALRFGFLSLALSPSPGLVENPSVAIMAPTVSHRAPYECHIGNIMSTFKRQCARCQPCTMSTPNMPDVNLAQSQLPMCQMSTWPMSTPAMSNTKSSVNQPIILYSLDEGRDYLEAINYHIGLYFAGVCRPQ